MEVTLGMTASIDDCSKTLDTEVEEHPSKLQFAEVGEVNAVRDLTKCQVSFQTHKCSAYCLRNRRHTKKSKKGDDAKRRVCRMGAGVEETFGKGDTPGFTVRKKAKVARDLRGFDRIDLIRNNKNITQCSEFLMRGWRGNCDIQYLIYESDPDKSDAIVMSAESPIISYLISAKETKQLWRKISLWEKSFWPQKTGRGTTKM